MELSMSPATLIVTKRRSGDAQRHFYGVRRRLLLTHKKQSSSNHNKVKSAMLIALITLLLLATLANFTCAGEIPTKTTIELIENVPFVSLNTSVFKIIPDFNDENNFIVAARNYILAVNSSLSIVHSYNNGPQVEDAFCPLPKNNCPVMAPKDQDNHIIFMLPLPPSPKIISCGTLYHGMCTINDYKLTSGGYVGRPVESSNYIASRKNTLAFAITGPNNQAAYMFAHEYDDRPLELSPPALAARHVDYEKGLSLRFVYNGRRNSSLDVKSGLKGSYPINYIYGFQEANFTYILSNQKVIDSSNRPKEQFTARIGRICDSDFTFNSYTELPLVCKSGREKDTFDIATAAHFGSLGEETANLLRFKKNRILFIAFSKSKAGPKTKTDHETGSVICAVSIDKLNSKFNDLTEKCFEGDGKEAQLHPAFNTAVGGDNSCEKHRFEKEYCGESSYNHYILGRKPVELESALLALKEDHKITSLVTYVNKKSTIAVLGGERGEVMKALLVPKDAPLKSLPHFDKGVLFYAKFASNDADASTMKVAPEPAMSKNGTFALLSVTDRIVKFPTNSCSIYPRCSQCVRTPDPLGCGWCGDKCATSSECHLLTGLSETCPPIISSFSPTSVPFHGKTRISIRGDNFGTRQMATSSPVVEILVGRLSIPCQVDKVDTEEIICSMSPFESSSLESASGQLRVRVDDTSKTLGDFPIRGQAIAHHPIMFFRAKVINMQPHSGPISGGTKIKIQGKNLDIGYNRRAYFVEQTSSSIVTVSECEIISVESNSLECRTSQFSGATNNTGQLMVQIDGQEIETSLTFTFKSDPQIKDIYPRAAPVSSQMKIKITGDNLNLIVKPYLRIGNVTKASCKVKNNQTISCSLPKVSDIWAKGHPHPIVITDDETPILTQLDRSFTFHPDPHFYQLSDSDYVYIDDKILELRGRNLSTAYPLEITVGDEKDLCIPISGDRFAIKCLIKFEKATPRPGDALDVKYSVGSLGGKLRKVVIKERVKAANPILIVSITVAAMAVLILAFFLFLRCRSEDVDSSKDKFVNEKSTGQYGYALNQMDETDGEARPLMNRIRFDEERIAPFETSKKLIANDYLKRGELIGKGHFGRVYKGSLELPDESSPREVAIKTLQYVNSPDELDSFLREATVMKDFDHQNVMSLVGLVFPPDEEAPLLVLPYMCNGDLLAYVRDETRMPRVRELMNFALDIACGMEYLAGQKFVHRDLAARNCMLDENLNVYVADFGLSKDVYEKGYYRPQERGPLPWKWMAPESIKMSIFTTKSDVWSYAITCWEIITRGAVPYSTVDNCHLEEYLDAGHRLKKPAFCAKEIYDLWLRCWLFDPKERPSFEEIVTEIKMFIESAQSNLQSHIPSNSTYSNVARGRYYNETGDLPDCEADNSTGSFDQETATPDPGPVKKPRVEYYPTTSL